MCFPGLIRCIFNSVSFKPKLKIIVTFAAFHVLTEITRALVSVQTLQDEYRDDNDDVDNSKLGTAIAILAVVNGLLEFLGNPVYGNLSDHIGRRPVLVMAACIRIGASILTIFDQSLTMIIISTAISSACQPYWLIFNTMIYDLVPNEEDRPRAFGALYASFFFVGFAGAIFWGLSWSVFTPTSAFAVSSLLLVISLILIILFVGETNEVLWIKFTGNTFRENPLAIPGDDTGIDGPTKISNATAEKIFEESMQKTSRNPFKLMYHLSKEDIKLKRVIVLRILDVACMQMWESTLLVLAEEQLGFELGDLVPYFVVMAFFRVLSNALMKYWEKCFSFPTLWKLSVTANLLRSVARMCLYKGATWILVLQLALGFPFVNIMPPLAIATLSKYTEKERKGEIFGGVQAAVELTNIICSSAANGLTAYFVHSSAPIYFPTFAQAIVVLFAICMAYLGFVHVFPELEKSNLEEEKSEDDVEFVVTAPNDVTEKI